MQKFKGKEYSTTQCVRNIIKVYHDRGNIDVTNWYHDANEFAETLSEKHNIPVAKVCGIIAAFSPLKSWTENRRIAARFLVDGSSKHTENFTQKAKDILQGSGEIDEIATILNGNKTTSFFMNLLQPDENKHVTIDRHALSICIGRNIEEHEGKGITSNQYNFFVNCYRVASTKLGVSATFLQSSTWEIWRENKKVVTEPTQSGKK